MKLFIVCFLLGLFASSFGGFSAAFFAFFSLLSYYSNEGYNKWLVKKEFKDPSIPGLKQETQALQLQIDQLKSALSLLQSQRR